ncbi:MAG TPA: LuxR C-terminal-related transcriptional regulator [Tepidisphaeraceae bacterium]|jgi:DNA-binding CsgD family transcriptional regulator
MRVPDSEGLHSATVDDVRGLLDAVNAVHLAERTERARTLATRVVTLLNADDAAVFVGENGNLPAWLAGSAGLPVPVVLTAGLTADLSEGITHSAARTTRPPTPAVLRSVYRADRLSVLAAWRQTPFGDRDQHLLGLLHQAVAWAFAPDAQRSGLPAGAEAVLELMLMGLPEKTIARRLGRSAHTVHSHIKRVYRHYRVSSRPELMARYFDKRTG